MARTQIAATTPVGPYPTLPVAADSLDVALTAADVANGNYVTFPGSQALLIVQNSDAANPYTFTITSSADSLGRTGDVETYSLAAGELAVILLQRTGWVQSNGQLYLNAENAAIKFALVRV